MTNKAPQSPEISAVIENQQAIASTHAAIATLENAIQTCEAQHKEQQAALPDLAPFFSQREDLLAATAIGENKSAEIEKLDTKIAKLTAQQNEAKPAMHAIRQTIGGLQRRLVEAQSKLQILQAENAILVRKFLLNRAETLGVEYFETAKAITAQYKRPMSLNNLLRVSGNAEPLIIGREGLSIPIFRLESIALKVDPIYPHVLFTSAYLTHAHTQEWTRQEKASLLEIGIEIE